MSVNTTPAGDGWVTVKAFVPTFQPPTGKLSVNTKELREFQEARKALFQPPTGKLSVNTVQEALIVGLRFYGFNPLRGN